MTIVSFDNVSKSFGGQQLFDGVSFALDERDHAVLVGRNGIGKTTLLRLMAGGEHADAGRVSRTRARRIWLHFSSRCPLRELWALLLERLRAAPT